MLNRLKESFQNQLAMFGVPVDEKEDKVLLERYRAKYKPAYQLLTELPSSSINEVKNIIQEKMKSYGLPATIITDNEGNIVKVMWGVPTVSEIHSLLNQFQLSLK